LESTHGAVAEAGQVAWLEYQAGRYAEAARWAARATPGDGITAWVRGRLALRDGDLDAAGTALATASAGLPSETWRTEGRFREDFWQPFTPAGEAAAEAAAVHLAEGHYVEAFEALLRTRYYLDAAYIAERVLTVDELRAWVDVHMPDTVPPPPPQATDPYYDPPSPDEFWGCNATACDPATLNDRVRWLLARRLVREGRAAEAVPYMPERHRADLVALVHARAASDVEDRLAAARLLREQGLELTGTELDPDYVVFGGNYQLSLGPDRMARTDALGPSGNERFRYRASAPTPDRRFHYRSLASDAMFDIAASLRDDEPRVAWVLCTGGHWADSDERAKRFYQTALARHVDWGDVEVWFGRCGEDPGPAPAWWPWRRVIGLSAGAVGILAAITWVVRWRPRPQGPGSTGAASG
jgi:hypothetical protein